MEIPIIDQDKIAEEPNLFGLVRSNRNMKIKENWGKNQFNNSFPAALACYMASRSVSPVYLKLNDKLGIDHGLISVANTFRIEPNSDNIFFSFETEYLPYQKYLDGKIPRVDLVTGVIKEKAVTHLRPLEIKLTTLPDDQTCLLEEEFYGCEIVVRPDTIVYLALSMALAFENDRKYLHKVLKPIFDLEISWNKQEEVIQVIPGLVKAIDDALLTKIDNQSPFLMQPIWKTKGKSSILEDNCLDIFMWSNFAFTRLFIDFAKGNQNVSKITRPVRSILWLGKMLFDFAQTGKINHKQVIDEFTYGTKNDKAFSIGGLSTYKYMKSPQLLKPRITKDEIKNIILGGGEKQLSPERRFDAVIVNSFVD